MRPSVAAERHAGLDHLLGNLRMPGRVLADFEERRFETIVSESPEDSRRVLRPGTVVEGQHHFFVAEKIVLLEVFEAEAGAAGGVDLDNARETQSFRFVTGRDAGARRGCGSG